jgi:hypothetical protein
MGGRSVANGWVERQLKAFTHYQSPLVVLGSQISIGTSESVWIVLATERIMTGEWLITLKARRGLSTLPDLDLDSVPEFGRLAVRQTVGRLAEAVYRESAGSIVDRARDAAHSCLATFATQMSDVPDILTDDLGGLIKRILHLFRAGEKHAFIHAAELVRVLHARGKWNVRKKHGLRGLTEDDAELAVRAVGFILTDFGWVSAAR